MVAENVGLFGSPAIRLPLLSDAEIDVPTKVSTMRMPPGVMIGAIARASLGPAAGARYASPRPVTDTISIASCKRPDLTKDILEICPVPCKKTI